jgi:mannose-1-phosphate guanylyltransferase
LLGTGGGLKNLRDWIEDAPLLLLAGDVLATDFDLADLADRHATRGALATMALVTTADIRRYGAVDVDDDGNITDIVGTLGRPGTRQAVNASAHVLEPAFVDGLPAGASCLVRQGYLPALSDGKRIAAWFHDQPWTELGTPDDLLAAQADALSGVLPVDDAIWAAAGRRDGARSLVHPSAEVAHDARLDDGTVVGAGAVVGSGAVLKRCLALPGAVVAPATQHDHCVLDSPSVHEDSAR